ncbi:hypothetical protein HON52_03060 [Candidatus Uhrbacteria bacterium]|mgnify:CR=1 FL=1|jgi:hypothetical protein|nr:hypothetical protein [Candidatus Uhrbacteria bacterium]
MKKKEMFEWVLRVAIAGEFIGHGVFALQGKEGWFKYFEPFGITSEETMVTILLIVGIVDLLVALAVLVKPLRGVLLWAFIWGAFTALLRWPIGPDPFWDLIERSANWGAPLALLLYYGWPKKLKDLFTIK